MGASYRSSADSPTALEKGAHKDKDCWPLFLMLARPKNHFYIQIEVFFIS
jgi:hypothetical protein